MSWIKTIKDSFQTEFAPKESTIDKLDEAGKKLYLIFYFIWKIISTGLFYWVTQLTISDLLKSVKIIP